MQRTAVLIFYRMVGEGEKEGLIVCDWILSLVAEEGTRTPEGTLEID